MKHKLHNKRRVKASHFPLSIFFGIFIILALLVTMQNKIMSEFVDFSFVPENYFWILLGYWLVISSGLTLFTRYQIAKTYDEPLKQMAEVTEQVANGDFSVYVKPLHTANKADYLDVMIEDFNKMVAELGSIEILKTDFFSNVSHEIKTPLAIIQNYAELLQTEADQEKREEYTQAILQATKRLSTLISDILKLSKLEKQTIAPIATTYDVCRQLCACAVNFETAWESKELEFIVDIEDSARIYADENLMELVWNNLLSNAIKFSEPKGRITLTQKTVGDEIIIQIQDQGCGMDEQVMNHMFDKFYQGDTSHAVEGNGLGLALVSQVLMLMGFSLSVHSTLEEGTTFSITIPAKRDEAYA